jgi:hypothetical protein
MRSNVTIDDKLYNKAIEVAAPSMNQVELFYEAKGFRADARCQVISRVR